jgi:hypothetical protein
MISRKGAFVVGVIAAMVIGSGTAYAANGGTLKLGHRNQATKPTTLKNSKGTALKLTSKAGTAPFAVSSGTKVANLNSDKIDGLSGEQFLRSTGKAADANLLDGLSGEQFLRSTGKAADAESVDGLDSTALALASGATAFVVANGVFVDLDADGILDALIATATCPLGTKLTGGGVDNFTVDGRTLVNSPSGGNQWMGASLADPIAAVPDLVTDLQAFAVCYNPRGAVAGGVPTLSQAAASAHATTASEIAPAAIARLAKLQSKEK